MCMKCQVKLLSKAKARRVASRSGRQRASSVQAAKTYLERKFEEFAGADLDTLIRHGLQARWRTHRPAD